MSAGRQRTSRAAALVLWSALWLGSRACPAYAQAPVAQAGSEESPAVERAADDARARELYALGDEFYANGRYEAAEEAFAEAYRLSGRALLLFNLANAQERSGRWREAAQNLGRYREAAPPSELPALDARITALTRRIADREAESRDEPVVVIQHESAELSALTAEAPRTPREPVRPERVLLPAAGALAVTTLALALRLRDVRQDVRAQCVTHAGQRLCSPEASVSITRDRRLSVATDVLGVVTLSAAALGVWCLVRGKRRADTADRTLQVDASRAGVQLSMRGAF